ncbi:hypothetical protein CLAFUW4_04852 [Fulvia fulva]|uniref:Uncharacterized protein n=1 Tax=Passalora fulva TaxID=5499 RepID=A0A9Q8PHS3_PASFU|nr:uncharacterized protein CLAFUR5_12053 [Fulvia fulva]KAK4626872.1 hypothetical protein CLAFUR4_04838 [Fulvia fulva]KAK4627727.1 hypothetical protein CLAFUR0_04842 [Fulvia fulva]UJO22652.1 hypothetical protein CLAFUR5_12053 [Fulvia fulva]WPV13681.1 hypothetical protein CLAFUW4_04852 [Fulvia fulva]WPV29148.1 hypothetical protein CLAFUW7_04846 [Fulvia fulva]
MAEASAQQQYPNLNPYESSNGSSMGQKAQEAGNTIANSKSSIPPPAWKARTIQA